jgi:Protein of unknown function (DUF3098)
MSKKKVITSTQKKTTDTETSKVSPTTSKSKSTPTTGQDKLIFGKRNYMFIGIGFGLILLGMLLMSGGGMEDPNEWKPEVVYSMRRTLLAPIVILSGLALQVYAIFTKETAARD